MTQSLTSKKVESSNISITKLNIKSNESGKTVSLLAGNAFNNVTYYESILQDTVRVTVTFADTGNSIDGKSVTEGLPLVGTEEVDLQIKDNKNQSLKIKLYVDNIDRPIEEAKKSLTAFSAVSEEFLMNEMGEVRIISRYDGKVSEHIDKILKKTLKTKKKCDIESTSNNYNFFGNNRKPFYILNWLSPRSVSSTAGKSGKTAGFFFFETSKGFNYKSIDGLFSQEPKRKFIYNQNVDKDGKVPAGYDGKILEHRPGNAGNIQQKFQIGAYATRLVVFNPFTCYYEVIKQEASKEGVVLGGKKLPKLNDKFKSKFTRTTYMLLDVGTLPTGGVKEQIGKAKEQNFEVQKTLNQAIRRYNQMFALVEEITIACDLGLNAGDVIYCDFPGLRVKRDDSVNKETGGKYIIVDLCHYISSDKVLTKLNLVRDSFGRTPPKR